MALRLIVLSILFFLPLLVLPFGVTHFETPKVIIFEILSSISVLVFIVASQKFYLKKWLISFGLLFILTTLDLVFRSSSVSFFGNAFRHQGILLLWMLLIFSYVSSSFQFPKIPAWVILTLLTIELFFTLSGQLTIDGRGVGTIGEPNSLAGFALCIWPFLLQTSSLREKGRFSTKALSVVIIVCGIILTGGTVLLSGSRSGLIGLAIQGIFLICLMIPRLSVSKATAICVILFLASLYLPFLQKTTQANEYENRPDVWKSALIAGYAHPILGWGVGNIEVAMQATDHKLRNRVQGYYVDSSHNIFLDWWVQGGFIGLAIFVVILYSTVRLFVIQKATVGLCILFGLLVSLSFNPGSVVELIFLWFLIGQALFTTI